MYTIYGQYAIGSLLLLSERHPEVHILAPISHHFNPSVLVPDLFRVSVVIEKSG